MAKHPSPRPPEHEGGVNGSTIPYFPHSGRRPHYWRIRKDGHRDFIISHGWGLCGAFCRKCIRHREVLLFRCTEDADYVLCKFIFKDDFWSNATKQARAKEAAEHRRGFRVVDTGEPEA